MSESGSFSCNSFKDIIDKAVHDGHGFAGDTGIGMDLLQNLVDVDSVTLLPPLLLFLVSLGDVLLGLTGLLCCLSSSFWCHFDFSSNQEFD